MECPFCHTPMVEVDIVPEALNPDIVYRSHPLPLVGAWLRDRMNERADKLRAEFKAELCPLCGFLAFFKRKH